MSLSKLSWKSWALWLVHAPLWTTCKHIGRHGNRNYSNKKTPCHPPQLVHQILYKMLTPGEAPLQYDIHTVAQGVTKICKLYK